MLCFSAQPRLLQNLGFRAAPGRVAGSAHPASCCCSHCTKEETEAHEEADWS